MNLRGVANQVSQTINPNILVTLQTSNGFTIGAGQRQVPQYNAPKTGRGQVQALDNSDLKQLEGLNIQGTIRALYVYGELAGVIRPDSKGGDLVSIGLGAPVALQGTWLVTKVLESWPEWTKVAICKQQLQPAPITNQVTLNVTAPNAGNFAIPHGLLGTPKTVRLLLTSAGAMWFQTPSVDATNVYLAASAPGLTANVWLSL